MNFVDPKLEAFCESRSSLPSGHCQALAAYTESNVPRSIMLSGPLVASFLGLLARVSGARNVLEIGCYTGYSALALAENLPPDGSVITLDIDEKNGEIARRFWAMSPHGKKIELILGPAQATLEKLSGPFDMVFIDADKPGYINYVKTVLPKLSRRGVIVADNSLFFGQVLDENSEGNGKAMREFDDWVAAQPNLYKTLLPVRDGLNLISLKESA